MSVTSAEFWDRVAPDYSKKPVSDTESYARKLAATQALMRPDMEMLAIGQRKAQQAGIDNVKFIQSSVEEFTADGSYDMVLALNLLHLLPDRTAALAKIHRLLKPGGLFISSTVCLADSMWYLRPVIPVLQWIGKAPYVSFVGTSDVLDEMAAAGFEEQEHWTHGGRANSLFLIASKA